jgi:predicted XRE-type DNA-binding protein
LKIPREGLSKLHAAMCFKDIGVPNADKHRVKAQLVLKIDNIRKDRGLKQVKAAELFGVRQPDISKMLAGSFGSFRSSAFCPSWWPSIRTCRAWSSRTAVETMPQLCKSFD